MSALSLSDCLAQLTADPVVAGHPVVADLVVGLETELAVLCARPTLGAGPPAGQSAGPSGHDPIPSGGPSERACRPLAGAVPRLQGGPTPDGHRGGGPALGARPTTAATLGSNQAPRACRVLSPLPDPDAGGLPRGRGRTGAVRSAPGGAGGLPVLCAACAGGAVADQLQELHGVALPTGTVKTLCRRAAARFAPEGARQWRQALTLSLWSLQEACLLFMTDPAMPFTNNGAEQALRIGQAADDDLGQLPHAGRSRVKTAHKRQWTLLDLLRQDFHILAQPPNLVPLTRHRRQTPPPSLTIQIGVAEP